MPPELLPEPVLSRARELPLKPERFSLRGTHVYLEPLDPERDGTLLFQVSNGELITLGDRTVPQYDPDEHIWRFMSAGPFNSLIDFIAYLNGWTHAPDTLPFCVFDSATRQPIGVTNFMNNVPQWLRIEVGGIWYSPVAQRTAANTEATYLMLARAFDMGYRRVEWKCDALNERSRRAAQRIGFTFEGIQESHMIVKGRNRDTAWYRILVHEWRLIKQRLEMDLYGNQP